MKIENLGFIVRCDDGSLTVTRDTDNEGIILFKMEGASDDFWLEVSDVKTFCKSLTDLAKEMEG